MNTGAGAEGVLLAGAECALAARRLLSSRKKPGLFPQPAEPGSRQARAAVDRYLELAPLVADSDLPASSARRFLREPPRGAPATPKVAVLIQLFAQSAGEELRALLFGLRGLCTTAATLPDSPGASLLRAASCIVRGFPDTPPDIHGDLTRAFLEACESMIPGSAAEPPSRAVYHLYRVEYFLYDRIDVSLDEAAYRTQVPRKDLMEFARNGALPVHGSPRKKRVMLADLARFLHRDRLGPSSAFPLPDGTLLTSSGTVHVYPGPPPHLRDDLPGFVRVTLNERWGSSPDHHSWSNLETRARDQLESDEELDFWLQAWSNARLGRSCRLRWEVRMQPTALGPEGPAYCEAEGIVLP